LTKKKEDPGVVATRLEIQGALNRMNAGNGPFQLDEFAMNDFRALQVADVNSRDPRRMRDWDFGLLD
jgi:hypothetical protein